MAAAHEVDELGAWDGTEELNVCSWQARQDVAEVRLDASSDA